MEQKYEKLDPKILDRFRYTECRSPLIVPVSFNKEGENMIRMLQNCMSKNILRIHLSMEELYTSLMSARPKSILSLHLDPCRGKTMPALVAYLLRDIHCRENVPSTCYS